LISPFEHYSRRDVQKEISDFCKGRWVALHYTDSSGNLVFRRYIKRKPIRVDSSRDLIELDSNSLRSIYATANVYKRLQNLEDVYDYTNIIYCTPTWDIDSDLSNWKKTITVAEEILRFLEEWGIKKSVYVKWSGNGCHIHINERSFSEDLLEKYNPLDIAYAIVEYVNSKLTSRFMELSPKGQIVVENKMDPTRVFTCPLSLHRKLNVVCICMKTKDLKNFTLKWIDPENFRHNPNWREFREGEADKLAETAYKTIGGYPLKLRRRRTRKTKPLDKQILEWLQRN